MIITGPSSPVQLRSLTIGSTNSGIAELRTQPTGQITIDDLSDPEDGHETLLVEATGKLIVDGVVNVLGGTTTNFGEIVLVTGAQLSGSAGLINDGVIRGNGTIDNALWNDVGGEIRVSTGQRLLFSGLANVNSGTIEVIGGEVEFTEIPYA